MSNESNEIDLGSPKPIEFAYRIGGTRYLLREAPDGPVREYKDAKMRAIKLDDGRASGITGGSKADVQLLSACLFEQNTDGAELRTVSAGILAAWPHRIVEPLVKRAKEISHVDESDTVEQIDREIGVLQRRREKLLKEGPPAKNSPSGGEATSPSPPDSASP